MILIDFLNDVNSDLLRNKTNNFFSSFQNQICLLCSKNFYSLSLLKTGINSFQFEVLNESSDEFNKKTIRLDYQTCILYL